MVVVLLVAVLAALAAPSFSEARNDRVAFDYARQYQQILVQARARAAGTGSAHLALIGPGGGAGRGQVRLYAALDGTPPTAGPNPVSSCKLDPLQWSDVVTDVTDYRIDRLVTNNRLRFIDYVELNRGGINNDMDLRAQLRLNGAALGADAVIAICITPSGVTYVGSNGGGVAAAIDSMRAAPPFTGMAEVRIQRRRAGTPVGLERIVQISGGGTPRLRAN